MTYQHWINSFATELAIQRPDVQFADIDPDFLEALYASGTLPADAVSTPLVFRQASPTISATLGKGANDDRKTVLLVKFISSLSVAVLLIGVVAAIFIRLAERPPERPNRDVVATEPSRNDPVPNYESPRYPDVSPTYPAATYSTNLPALPPSNSVSDIPRQSEEPVYRYNLRESPTPNQNTSSGENAQQIQFGRPTEARSIPSRTEGPTINQFDAQVSASNSFGSDGKLVWSVKDASSVEISKNGKPIPGFTSPDGSLAFANAKAGDVFTITATKNGVTTGTSVTIKGG